MLRGAVRAGRVARQMPERVEAIGIDAERRAAGEQMAIDEEVIDAMEGEQFLDAGARHAGGGAGHR